MGEDRDVEDLEPDEGWDDVVEDSEEEMAEDECVECDNRLTKREVEAGEELCATCRNAEEGTGLEEDEDDLADEDPDSMEELELEDDDS